MHFIICFGHSINWTELNFGISFSPPVFSSYSFHLYCIWLWVMNVLHILLLAQNMILWFPFRLCLGLYLWPSSLLFSRAWNSIKHSVLFYSTMLNFSLFPLKKQHKHKCVYKGILMDASTIRHTKRHHWCSFIVFLMKRLLLYWVEEFMCVHYYTRRFHFAVNFLFHSI